MRSFIIAIQFLTRIPVPGLGEIGEHEVGRSLAYYPLVGLVIGVLLSAFNWILADTPAGLQAGLILALWVLITGALHLDGLADSADAWIGGLGNKERTLQIMKDPRCGPAAVVLVVLLLLIKFSALQVLIENEQWQILILSPLLARTSLPLLFQTTAYVRKGGIGSAMAEHVSSFEGILLPMLISLTIIIMMGWSGLVLILSIMGVFILLRAMMMQRLDGITGDTAGALVEVIEMLVLVVAVLLPIT
ncbi:Cobalamin synthase [hydrothermal vent metagenome]|uniref:Adenosylcobinamide-GDP ribazoletransferase n=1 Tax=hydrothermal vent metagenome TaxID=652676 RepID=A0A3B1BHB8_9ZZZZ